MSPRAAWRLESLGFESYDFVPGKTAWYQENEAREGKAAEDTWIGDVMDTTVPTCSLAERIGDIRERLNNDDHGICVVVNEARIVLGVLRKKALSADASATAEQVMQSGPSTFRPNVTLEEMLKFMRDRDLKGHSLITPPDGRLLGIIARDDMEATVAHESPESGS